MRHAAIYLTVLTIAGLASQTASAQIAWVGKLRDAHTHAKQQGKLMLLHFYTDNCVYCDRLEAGAFQSASVSKAINQNFVPVKVHGAKNPKLAEMFKVTKYPTDVIVTTDGKALSHSVSPQQPDRYIAMLSGAQADYVKSKTMIASGKQSKPKSSAVDSPSKVKSSSPTTTPAYASNPPQLAASSSGFAMPPAGAMPPADASASTAESKGMPIQIPGTADSSLAMGTPTPTASLASAGKPKQNKFVLPDAVAPSGPTDAPTDTLGGLTLPASAGAVSSGSVSATLAGARNKSMELPSDGEEISRAVEAKPELAIQGFCAVSVVNDGEWIEGKPELGVIHLGKLYLFSDKAAMDLFLADPIPFTPMLNEIDVVRFFEEKKIVQGKREWGVIDPVHNRMFFFADEAAMLHFEQEFSRYLDASIQVMDTAIKESNPGA